MCAKIRQRHEKDKQNVSFLKNCIIFINQNILFFNQKILFPYSRFMLFLQCKSWKKKHLCFLIDEIE